MRIYRLLLVFALSSTGCGSSGSDGDPKATCATGAETCACYANATCNAGLDCRSSVCVAPVSAGGSSAGGSSAVAGGGGGPAGPADKENGDTCSSAAECSSGICEESTVGERHCYGDAQPDETCDDTFDCDGGVCIERSLTGAASVCNLGLTVCFDKAVSPERTAYIIDLCRQVQFCGADVSSKVPAAYASLDQCIGIECTSALDGAGDLTPAQCLNGSSAILGGAPCP
jgi:hypothetical protein